MNLVSFCNSFLRSFRKVYSNINFDRKKTLIQMFVIDKESKCEIFRHSFISVSISLFIAYLQTY